MPAAASADVLDSANTISGRWQVAAWLAALSLCWLGLQGLVAEWQPDLALLEFGWLLLAPVVWGLGWSRSAPITGKTTDRTPVGRTDLLATAAIAGVALGLSLLTAAECGDLPPAYHDEYSYLFQAQTLLDGRWSWESPPVMPELFDQFHVLNEGRMASRYYPGTGLWLAPWLWLGHVYVGQWIAGAVAAALVYWIGRELDGRLTGWLAGIAFAAAPGPALFSNLLLAHHATLLSLMVFLLGFVRGARTNRWTDFLLSGGGLGFALLCRPATAAGMGLPFAIWCAARTYRAWQDTAANPDGAGENQPARGRRLLQAIAPCWVGYGLPLVVSAAVMASYNSSVTGNWRTSPYQLYTDIYTPRHVYGFNNVVRGEQRLGPKVLDDYDRWAENLTPGQATINTRNRWLITGLWTIGIPLLTIAAVLSLPLLWGSDQRWQCVAWGIVSLHAIHWPYWYVGIMGWHYVFETAPLWCLLLGHAASRLRSGWLAAQRPLLWGWFCILLPLAWSGMYATVSEDWSSRWIRGCGSIIYPRLEHARFREWVRREVGTEPALVLIDPTASNPHLDLVVNDAGLQAPILYGRLRPGQTDVSAVIAAFPDRRVYIARPSEERLIPAR